MQWLLTGLADPAALIIPPHYYHVPVKLAAQHGHVDALRMLIDHPCVNAADMLMQTDGCGSTALMQAAEEGHLDVMRLLLDHPSADAAAMALRTSSKGTTALMLAAQHGRAAAVRLLLDHPSTDAAAMMVLTTSDGGHHEGDTALMQAAEAGHVDVMRLLLNHPSANAVALLKHTCCGDHTALMYAAHSGNLDAMRLLLEHPAADAAAMIMHTASLGSNAFMWAAQEGHVEAMRLLVNHSSADAAALLMDAEHDGWMVMQGGARTRIHLSSGGSDALRSVARRGHVDAVRLLLDHPSVNPAALLMRTDTNGWTALMHAAENGQINTTRLPLDHPDADAAAMMAVRSTRDCFYGLADSSALVLAAGFVTRSRPPFAKHSCATLLLLLRRAAAQPQSQPCDAQQAHMSEVMQVLCQGPRSDELFDPDQPDDARDECVRMLIELGARMVRCNSPVMLRIFQELAQLARVPQLINEAVLGMVMERQQQKQ